MTEPKKEKCEACCGSGYINFWTDDGHISMRTCRRCDGYGYIKAKPMTNEEWFCSLSTTEKAEFLSTMAKKAESISWWDDWLKEKHESEGSDVSVR